jgi:sugar lactone lactonase YvrE
MSFASSRSSRLRRLTASMLGVVLLLGAIAVPASAARPLPTRIDLPDGFQPEGIESWGRYLYAGSLADGSIWRADARTGELEPLVPATTGAVSVGLHIDQWGRLWVAGGPTGTIRVYDARTGEPLATYQFPTPTFLNDLDLVDGAVYATDSINQRLAVVPLGPGGALPDPSAATTMPLTGDLAYTTGFNANGIARVGAWLVLVQTNTGMLFRVDPDTGQTTAIDTGGYSVTFGDGLEARGRTLYVVRNQIETVAVLRLSGRLTSARLIGEITEANAADLSVPTTATLSMGSLWVVNARFGTPPTPDTEYWISRLPTRP